MVWTIEWDKRALKELTKLDKVNQSHILRHLSKILESPSPREHGKPLKGRLSGLWRYRVGQYRLICQLEDDRCVVFIVRVAHRKRVYERLKDN